MITFFTTAKGFRGHFDVIQRNAIRSWQRLDPRCEVILLGDDPGAAEVARELGLLHIPTVTRNEHGSALVNDMFERAEKQAAHDLLCYVNADIILMQDFWRAACQVRDLRRPFLMCGRRTRLNVTAPLSFEADWEERMRREAATHGSLDAPEFVDYFLFTRGIFGSIPPFAIGRRRWDRWLQYRARAATGCYIDATRMVVAIHQNHDYGAAGFVGHKQGVETEQNIAMAGEEWCDVREATHILTRRGLRPPFDWLRLRWRLHQYARVFAPRTKRLNKLLPQAIRHRKALMRPLKAALRLLRRASRKPGDKQIVVVGLGKIGFPLAVCLAHKGHTIAGVDTDPRKIAEIRQGRAPVPERMVNKLLAASRDRLSAHREIERVLPDADVTIIALPTQQHDDRAFVPDHLRRACAIIGRTLGESHKYHLVVVVSTVLPGWMDTILRPALEEGGRKVGRHFGLCYWPQFVAIGDTVRGNLNPEFSLIGESDAYAGKMCELVIRRMWDRPAPTMRTNFNNAEIAKLALNTYVSAKISFGNAIALMCEKFPNANADTVTATLQLDSRIGRGFLTGGTSYGGPCFPGDVRAFEAVARHVGSPADAASAADAINTAMRQHIVDLVRRLTPPLGTVGVCGVAFKTRTGVTDVSAGLLMAHELRAMGHPVLLYNAEPLYTADGSIGDFDIAASLSECIRRSSTIVLALPEKEFARLGANDFQDGVPQRAVIDCWRVLDGKKLGQTVRYYGIGLGRAAALDEAVVAARDTQPA
jgi:UDPglucose 6-dehydrogenase